MGARPTLDIIANLAIQGDWEALAAISEASFSIAVCDYAREHGWLVHYQRQSGHVGKDGTWRGSGPKGFPDLVLARAGRVLMPELKAEKGVLSPEQKRWGKELGASVWDCWRPRDSGRILKELE